MPMSRLRTDRQTDGNVKVEHNSAEAESAIANKVCCCSLHSRVKKCNAKCETKSTVLVTVLFLKQSAKQSLLQSKVK